MILQSTKVAQEAIKTINQNYDWGVMMPWIFGIVAVVIGVPAVVFILLKGKNIKLQVGKNKVDLTGEKGDNGAHDRREMPRLKSPVSKLEMTYLHLFSALHDGKIEFKNAAWAAQKDFVDDVEEDFFMIFETHSTVRRDIDSVWTRFKDIMKSAADNNHVRRYVNNGIVSPDYLFEKTSAFEKKYRMLCRWEGFDLPDYDKVHSDIDNLIKAVLSKFGRIADENNEKFSALKARLVGGIDDPEVKKFMEEVL